MSAGLRLRPLAPLRGRGALRRGSVRWPGAPWTCGADPLPPPQDCGVSGSAPSAARSVAVDSRRLDEGRESGRIVHSEIRQHLAVDLDVGSLEAGDELRVGRPVLAGGGVDAGDPQPAELALAGAAIPVGVGPRMHHLLVGRAESATAGPLVALGLGEDLLVGFPGGNWVPGACHLYLRSVTWPSASWRSGDRLGPGRHRRRDAGRRACPWRA